MMDAAPGYCIVGGGIAGLAAAALLLRDAGVPGDRIRILEQGSRVGGSLDGAGNPGTGYVMRGGRMLEPHFGCTFDLFDSVPSLTSPGRTVTREILDFTRAVVTSSKCRLVSGRQRQEAPPLQLSPVDRLAIGRLLLAGEARLGEVSIETWFGPRFLATNFWYLWASMFAFQPWHSVAECRRYMLRFMHLLPGFNRLEGIVRTPFNQYDSLVRPLRDHLARAGVVFVPGVEVRDIRLVPNAGHLEPVALELIDAHGRTQLLDIGASDRVFATLGSMTAQSALGDMDTPPVVQLATERGAWGLWQRLAARSTAFGRPLAFCSDVARSGWTSFTLTLRDPAFFHFMEGFTGNAAGTGGLVTFRDSGWLMSVVLAHQPHFLAQPGDVQVCWGYALRPGRDGDLVRKPMSACNGREILDELLHQLPIDAAAASRVRASATVIPCAMPYITSQFMPRRAGDRPAVLPRGTRRLALVGQFCELPEDCVFTVEYSVRSAQAAVYGLCEVPRRVTPLYRGHRDPRVLLAALRAL